MIYNTVRWREDITEREKEPSREIMDFKPGDKTVSENRCGPCLRPEPLENHHGVMAETKLWQQILALCLSPAVRF